MTDTSKLIEFKRPTPPKTLSVEVIGIGNDSSLPQYSYLLEEVIELDPDLSDEEAFNSTAQFIKSVLFKNSPSHVRCLVGPKIFEKIVNENTRNTDVRELLSIRGAFVELRMFNCSLFYDKYLLPNTIKIVFDGK